MEHTNDEAKELVSVRFAFPSGKKKCNDDKGKTKVRVAYGKYKIADDIDPGDACIINGVPCRLVVKDFRPAGKQGWRRYIVTGKSMLIGKRHHGAFTTDGVKVPLTKIEDNDRRHHFTSLKECWKVQHDSDLQPPDNKNYYVMECIYQSETKLMKEFWELSMKPYHPNEFPVAAVAFLRAQEKERFYYFLCAAQKQDFPGNPEALSTVLEFLCGPRTEQCNKLSFLK